MSHAKREACVVGGSARHLRRYARMTRWKELQDIAMLSAVQTCDHMSLHMSINSITTFDMFALEKSAVVTSSCHSSPKSNKGICRGITARRPKPDFKEPEDPCPAVNMKTEARD